MSDERYWVIQCKLCGRHHLARKVVTTGPTADVRFDGPFPCPTHPGETAYYESGSGPR
jgi:hypothetical protein